LNGRAAPGTTAQIYYCAIEGFVVRIVDGPRRVDGVDWYNAEGIGWMASTGVTSGVTFLERIGPQSAPDLPSAGCYTLTLKTTKTGEYTAPDRIQFDVPLGGGYDVMASDGNVAGWLYGTSLYRAVIGGRPATGTIRAEIASGSPISISGEFVATAFGPGGGAEGTVSGTRMPRCTA
jgi:hypothetical protein